MALVFGGGRLGLKATLTDAVLAARGQAIGVLPRALVEKEIAHTSLTELHVADVRWFPLDDLPASLTIRHGGPPAGHSFTNVRLIMLVL